LNWYDEYPKGIEYKYPSDFAFAIVILLHVIKLIYYGDNPEGIECE